MCNIAKKLITLCVVVVLMVGLAIPTAFATSRVSTATVDYGSTGYVTGGTRTLYGTSLSGTIQAKEWSGTADMTGYMYTQGSVFTHKRDTASVAPGGHPDYLYWENPGHDTGVFWSGLQAPGGNQGGTCTVERP